MIRKHIRNSHTLRTHANGTHSLRAHASDSHSPHTHVNDTHTLRAHASHFCFAFILIISIATLTACQNLSLPTPSVPASATPTLSPAAVTSSPINPEASPTPNVTPEPTQVNVSDAQLIVASHIDFTKYKLSLADSYLQIGPKAYYMFFLKEGNKLLTPSVLVDQYNGNVQAFYADGTMTAFDVSPYYYDNSKSLPVDGRYLRYSDSGQETSFIDLRLIANGNRNTFKMVLRYNDGETDTPHNITVEPTSGMSVSEFKEGNLYFAFSPNAIYVSYDQSDQFAAPPADTATSSGTLSLSAPDISVSGDAVVSGVYYYQTDNSNDEMPVISVDEATTLLRALTAEQARLPEPLANYTLTYQNDTELVKGEVCYTIGAYITVQSREILVTTFYVTTDGKHIYLLDLNSLTDKLIYSSDPEEPLDSFEGDPELDSEGNPVEGKDTVADK